MSNIRTTLTILTVAATAGTALADGRIWASDGSGRFNGANGSGGAFVMNRIGTAGANGFNNAQVNAGYVGSRLGEQGLAAGAFHTFCIERNESIELGSSNATANRYYAQISDSAKGGGFTNNDPSNTNFRSNGTGEDVISFTTAKIYSEFRNNGNFGGIGAITDGQLTDGQNLVSAIQDAIWYSEGELNTVSGTALAIFNWAAANHGNTLGDVRVLNLWTNFDPNTGTYSGNGQDQLVLIPLPSASALAGVGLLVLAARRRKMA
jgi:hypothetical protein